MRNVEGGFTMRRASVETVNHRGPKVLRVDRRNFRNPDLSARRFKASSVQVADRQSQSMFSKAMRSALDLKDSIGVLLISTR